MKYPSDMPSPVGHALGGIAAGWLVTGTGNRARHPGRAEMAAPEWTTRRTALYAAAGAAADLDLLTKWHRGPSHSLGAAVLVGVVAWLVTRGTGRRDPRTAFAIAAAYASHVLLDWLGSDTRPPIGIPALWPISQAYYESSLHLFAAVSRRYWLAEFWTYNLYALGRELLILGPIVIALYLTRRNR